MRSKIIVANWKLNGNWTFNEEFASALTQGLDGQGLSDRKIVICPPCIYLQQLNGLLLEEHVFLGAQDVSDEMSGAFTGEISVAMLKDFGCRYVIVGHSERRLRHFETNELVVKKARLALSLGITPIICLGETLEERDNGQASQALSKQLESLMLGLGETLGGAVLAYEPVWAIGTGENASTSQVQEVHAWIRSQIELVSPVIAQNILLIYGGSVKAGNATELLSQPDVDGVLVGGASLVPTEFLTICVSGIGK
jgi:triosephosphate isomerase